MSSPSIADEQKEPTAATINVLYAGDPLPDGPQPPALDEGESIEVTTTADFVVARDILDQEPIDAVVTTVRDGGFDGVAFLEALRQEYAALPVVLLTATVDGAIARRAVDADVTALYPTHESGLLDRIVETIEANVSTYARERGPRMPISDLTVEAERRLKERALDEAPIGITISDAREPDNPTIYINDSFEEITGYAAEEAIGVNHRFLQGPETDPDQVAKLAEAVAEKRNTRVVVRNYTREEVPFWNQVDVSPIVQDGEVTHYVGFQMDVTERRRAQEKLQAERESLDRLLDRIEGLANDVTAALVRAGSRAEIEGEIVDRVGTGGEYAAAWIGRYDGAAGTVRITEQAGDRNVAPTTLDLDADTADRETLQRAIETQEATLVEDPSGFPWADADETCLIVPLTYRSTVYGVLGVLDDENLVDDRERVLLGTLGRTVGATINDVVTKRTIATDTVLDVGVELVDEDLLLVQLATTVETSFEHEATITSDQEAGVLVLVRTATEDPDAVVEAAADYEGILAAETITATDTASVLQFRLAESPIVDVLSEFGSRVTGMQADASGLELEFQVGSERAARRTLEELEATYDQLELVFYRESDPEQTTHGFREDLRDRLTDRQLTALKKAYVSGYFEWPREAEGKELAESMGIVPSTFHQHLQAAKEKLVGAFFEE